MFLDFGDCYRIYRACELVSIAIITILILTNTDIILHLPYHQGNNYTPSNLAVQRNKLWRVMNIIGHTTAEYISGQSVAIKVMVFRLFVYFKFGCLCGESK